MVPNACMTNFRSNTACGAGVSVWHDYCAKRACEACHTCVRTVPGGQPRHLMMTLSDVNSGRTSPTGCGSPTSLNTGPATAGFTVAPSSTRSRDASSDGPSQTGQRPTWSQLSSRWPAGPGVRNQERSFTRIVERNTRVGFSAIGCAKQDCWAPWARSLPTLITR